MISDVLVDMKVNQELLLCLVRLTMVTVYAA